MALLLPSTNGVMSVDLPNLKDTLQGIWQIFFEGTGQSLQITEAPLEGNHKSEDKISERGLGVKETQTQTGLANLFEYLLLHPQPPQ